MAEVAYREQNVWGLLEFDDQISMDRTSAVLQVGVGLAATMAIALCACSQSGDAASDRGKLIGSYTLVVGTNQPVARKDLESSVLKLSPDGTFIQECRYASGTTDSVSGTWSYSNRHVQFSVFRDCAGVWPRSPGERDVSANLIVELTSPTTILLSPDTNVRYERHG
jgi:hypothetical protein